MKARRPGGFTLVELMVVLAIIGVLSIIIAPAAARAMAAGRRIACAGQIREMNLAFLTYLGEHDGRWFPWRENAEGGGTLWYWGYEAGGGGAEGARPLDKSRARLAPYFEHVGGLEICPAMPLKAPYFKRKFVIASYGYGLNPYLLAGIPVCDRSGVPTLAQVTRPGDTIAWADAIQINTFQAPASPSNPMLEEWYYVDNATPPKFHFRHRRQLNAAYLDGSIRAHVPVALDPRCDGQVGFLEAAGKDDLLRTNK